MEVLLAAYHDRKVLLWDISFTATGLAVVLSQGWVPVPEAVKVWDTPSFYAAVLITTVVICLSTRLWSGRRHQNACSANGRSDEKSAVPILPYWVPYFGHVFQLSWNAKSFLRRARESSLEENFALSLAGTTHVIVNSPSATEALAEKDATFADGEAFVTNVRKNVFGLDGKLPTGSEDAPPALSDAFYNKVISEPHIEDFMTKSLRGLKEHLPSMITFMPKLVDQTPWERAAGTSVVETPNGQSFAETNLLLLIREFTGNIITPAFAGTGLVEDYPNIQEDLATFEENFYVLASGLPRWTPIPGIPAGTIARKRLLDQLAALSRAYDQVCQGADTSYYRDVTDFPALFTISQETLASGKASPQAKASSHLSILWTLNASVHNLVFWLLVHILGEEGLAERVRKETQQYVRATQPTNEFNLPEPPRIALDLEGLLSKCALLEACYMETIRLYDNSWTVKRVKQDFLVKDGDETLQLEEGQYVDISTNLHNTDSQYYSEVEEFKPQRFISAEEGQAPKANWGNVRHEGGMWRLGASMEMAHKLSLAVVASLLAIWEVEPTNPAGWRIPSSREAALIARPRRDVRVRISRRDLGPDNRS